MTDEEYTTGEAVLLRSEIREAITLLHKQKITKKEIICAMMLLDLEKPFYMSELDGRN